MQVVPPFIYLIISRIQTAKTVGLWDFVKTISNLFQIILLTISKRLLVNFSA